MNAESTTSSMVYNDRNNILTEKMQIDAMVH